jgi:hypothetical protein
VHHTAKAGVQPEHHQRFAAVLLQNEEVMLAKRVDDPLRQFAAGLAFALERLSPTRDQAEIALFVAGAG